MGTESSSSPRTEDTYDRAKEMKEFEDSKLGVKGLVESGIRTIPRFFLHPPEILSSNIRSQHPGKTDDQIPTIDLSGLGDSNPTTRAHIVAQIHDGAAGFGFFQIANHGIPVSLMDRTISAVKEFHRLPAEQKKQYYNRNYEDGVIYYSNYDLFRSRAATWQDVLGIQVASDPVLVEYCDRVPAICRSEILEWKGKAKKLGEELGQLLCEGLGIEKERLKEMKCLDSIGFSATSYPYCPQPDLTLGLGSHTDPLLLTILLQDQTGGLQAKTGEEDWVHVKPVHGALVINIGDLLQIMSNGKYRSVEHRVVANRNKEPRVSVAAFIGPNATASSHCYGPLPELISEDEPASYRNFSMEEFTTKFNSKELSTAAKNFKL